MREPVDFNSSVGIIIGIDAYSGGIPPLRTARNDAVFLAQALKDHHGYDVKLLVDDEATLQRIVDLLENELPETVGVDDRVLFYFAGHGVALDGDTGPAGYLLPHDAQRDDPESTFLDMPRLHDALTALDCRHMLAILDSCFSGAFRWSATRDVIMAPPKVIHQERFDRFVHDPAWQVIASASHDQKAFDALESNRFGERGERGGHSPFASVLHEALAADGDVLEDNDGEVPAESLDLLRALRSDGVFTATELYLYLEHVLQSETTQSGNRQTPSLWPLDKHDKGEFVFLVPGHELNLPPAPPLNLENNPYRGLTSYESEDAPLFFGRDDEIEALRQHVSSHPLSVILGASGTGKSSLVKAGLLPRLAQDVEQSWHVLPVVRPGISPLRALAHALPGTDQAATSTPALLSAIESSFEDWFRRNDDTYLMLVIDQFEELVTIRSGDQNDILQALLQRLLDRYPKRLRVTITLRTDFEASFAGGALSQMWDAGRYIVPPMSRENLQDVITEPAALKVMYFKPGSLVDTLVNEVAATPGALPLLSFTLSEMYIRYVNRQDDDRCLTEEDYAALGGVVGALRSRADEEYDALQPPLQLSMRRVMLRMVSFEGNNVARQRILRADLDYTNPAETQRVDTVVERLTEARLLVEGREADGEPYVEPAHDALVRAWDRLIDWIHEEEESAHNLRYQQQLGRAATEWEKTDARKIRKDLLWRGPAQASVLAHLVREKAPWMNRREVAFARRSIRRRTNIRLSLAGLFLLIFAAMVTAVGLSFSLVEEQNVRQKAQEKRDQIFLGLLSRANIFSVRDALQQEAIAGTVEPTEDGWTTLIEEPQGRFAIARLYGNRAQGRVIAAGHDSVLGYRDQEDNALFLEIALMWLQGEKGSQVLISTGKTEAFSAYAPDQARWLEAKLGSWQYDIVHASTLTDRAQLQASAVLIIGNAWAEFEPEEIDAIEQFVAGGGGLLVVGLGWSWRAYGPVPRGGPWNNPLLSLDEYPMNALMAPFGMRWTADQIDFRR